jgi:4-hydroxybenzoate polyprenyltransferase
MYEDRGLPIELVAVVWKKVTDVVLYSSLFIAACAFGLVAQTYMLVGQEVSWRVAGMLFFATLFLYNLESLLPGQVRPPLLLTEKKRWLVTHQPLMRWVALVAGGITLWLFLGGAPVYPLWFLLHLLLISVLYTIPVASRKYRLLPLRKVPFLKVFLVAYVWAALTVLLPLLYLGREVFAPEPFWMFVRRFLFIFALALLFDIRDFTKDKALDTYTFPVVLGIPFTKGLSLIVMFVFMLLAPIYTHAAEALALLLSGLVSAAVIIYAHEDRSEYYFGSLADGMMLFQFLLVALLV